MFYSIYRDVRDSAWQCLLNFNVTSLPVDVLAIARAANIRVVRNSLANRLSTGEKGKALTNGRDWIIIYDDTQPVDVCRFTLAHELGHIFLGHDLKYAKYAGIQEFVGKGKSEQQADAFAVRLLCPACILHSLGLTTAEQIATMCRVPLDVATLRANRMRELNKRDQFLTSPLEKEVYENFRTYLSDHRHCHQK